jgi:hypothetical protein
MEVEESVSGFKVRGSWGDIVEHGERLTRALKDLTEDEDCSVDEDALEEWDEWRPKADERLREDVNEKTAEQASVAEGEGEQAGKTPDEDIKTAGEKLAESYENLEEEGASEAVDGWRESINYVARAADSATRKALRKVEGSVYKNVMTQMSPYYFDNELVSANIDRIDADDYVFEVNVNVDDLKIRVSNKLADYETSVERWHVDTPKETDIAEAVEGHEPPEEAETHGESDPKQN